MKRLLTALPIVCVMAGCATTQGTSALEGGGIGAVVGYAGCKLLGGNHGSCAAIAAGGAAVGATIGHVYANKMVERREELAGKENDLDARLRYVRGLNQDTEVWNKQLQDRVAKAKQQTDVVVAQMNKGTISTEELTKQRLALDNEVKSASDQLVVAEAALSDMKAFKSRQSQPSGELDTEVARLEGLMADAQRSTTALASQRQRM